MSTLHARRGRRTWTARAFGSPAGSGWLPRHLWIGYLTVGGLAIVGCQLTPDKETRDITYLVLGLIGVVGIFAGVRIHRPVLRTPWLLMAWGQLLWVTGDAVYTWLEDVRQVAPFPSPADVFYLGAYPVLALGLVMLVRGQRPRRDLAPMLDSLVVTAGLGLLSWVVLAQPTIAESQESAIAATVAVAYPVADVLLVAALMLLLVTPGGRAASMRLLLGAIGLLIVADSLYLALSLFGTGESHPIDFLWLASYLLWGAAALHPSMAPVSRPSSEIDVRFRRTRLAAMTLAALIAPGTLAIQRLTEARLDVWAVITGSVIIVLLVVVRMKIGIDQVTAVNAQLELMRDELVFQAAHDPLTGLPNRAQAMSLIQAGLSRARRGGDLIALLFIDLDGFKAVNDTHGHRAGDRVLCEVGQRLREHVRAGDTPARLGGDEFVVLLEPVDTESSAIETARRLVAAISQAIALTESTEAVVGASIGIAFNHDLGTDPDVLLHEADTAAYLAKAHGRGRVEVLNSTLEAGLGRHQADVDRLSAQPAQHLRRELR